jgi:CPA2 family monovalent cation:H+ antiporter-2
MVLAISDLEATRQAVRVARRLHPGVHILARTRAVSEIDSLRRLGADEVIPEEFETSIEIFSRVLDLYHIPRNIIDAQVRILRDEGYGLLRGAAFTDQRVMDRVSEILQGTLTETFLIRVNGPADGRTLRERDLRRRTSASVIALVRDGEPHTNPEPDAPLAVAYIGVGRRHAALCRIRSAQADPTAPQRTAQTLRRPGVHRRVDR